MRIQEWANPTEMNSLTSEDKFLDKHDWHFPLPIRYGPATRFETGSYCRRAGVTRPLVVTDRATATLEFVQELIDNLEQDGLRPILFSDVNSNPTDQNVAAGIEQFRHRDADGVIALGGGSGMDAGKAIAFVSAAGADAIWDFDFLNPNTPACTDGDFAPLICIPTTAGTGAEADSGAIVTDTERLVKRCIYHPDCQPEVAILDPELTRSLPPDLTAWTGCDALVHAIEAYCVAQFHPLCDGIALQAMRLIADSIRQSVAHGDDLSARGAMLTGSCLAGISFTKGLGLVHATSHMIGAVFDTHHGLTNAVMLPSVLRFNKDAIVDKVPGMCHAMGLEQSSFEGFYNAITELLDELNIPDNLASLGVREESVADVANKTMSDLCLPTNPRVAELADVEALISRALTKAR